MDVELLDITPTPRVLRVLGEIPFASWQCIAELIDNSIDAMTSDTSRDGTSGERRIIVSWSSDAVPLPNRTLEVIDTGPGMSLQAIQDCVRAGYSSNDPVSSLGLFGMGFNIATARLGDKATFLSATAESREWVGVEIDYLALISSRGFRAPVVRVPKTKVEEHGSKVVVSRLKPSLCAELNSAQSEIRRVLAEIYAPILRSRDIEIMVQGTRLPIIQPCVWDEKRYVSLKGVETVPAIIRIDEVMGEAFFDQGKNRYLTPYEEDELRVGLSNGRTLPDGIVQRTKRIHGWLGVQRYGDPTDYGLDFIRNGRKIVRRDKALFSFRHPMTGTEQFEYPWELGTTVGGRIIGEIHIDHVPPTYQKVDFDRTDPTWYEVVEVLRGDGPIRPSIRKALGYTDANMSPLGRLVRGYDQVDAGTKNVAANNTIAKQFAKRFFLGDPEYQTDEKWWEAAQEADREKADRGAGMAPPVDPGTRISDNPAAYVKIPAPVLSPAFGGSPNGSQTSEPGVPEAGSAIGATTLAGVTVPRSDPAAPGTARGTLPDDPKKRSRQIAGESVEYAYPGCRAPFVVQVWELQSGKIGEGEDGDSCVLQRDGNRCDFIYNPRHPFLRDYPITHHELLLMALADRFKVRDNLPDIVPVFMGMWMDHFPDERIDQLRIQEKAQAFFTRLRSVTPELLALREQEALGCVHESSGEVEETCSALIDSPDLLRQFQACQVGGINALVHVPARTLVRLIDRFPEEFFDGKYFNVPFLGISLPDQKSTERLRAEAKDRLLSFIKDALWVTGEVASTPRRRRKAELARCSYSLAFLEQEASA